MQPIKYLQYCQTKQLDRLAIEYFNTIEKYQQKNNEPVWLQNLKMHNEYVTVMGVAKNKIF